MTRVYISSTFDDLEEHRRSVYLAVRRLGYQSVAMEDYVAMSAPLVERCLADVRASDVLVALVAWRYGYVPEGSDRSITEMEVDEAEKRGIPCLFFLVADGTPWPRERFDADLSRVSTFRQRIRSAHLVSFFGSSDELGVRVAAALSLWVASGRATAPVVPEAIDVRNARIGPEVFLSYAHEDLEVAKALSARLSSEAWSVFWDREIPVGLNWDDIVEAAIDAAHCIVVLWSSYSRDSEWVRLEANEGAERQILAPALIEEVKIPLRFRRIQAANLIGWRADTGDTPGLQALLAAVRRCLSRASSAA